MPDAFPLPLDGILASEARRRRLGADYGTDVRDWHIERIGLCIRDARGWVFAASCAQVVGRSEEDVIWWHRRVRHARAEEVLGAHLPPIIREGIGHHGARRMPLVVTACAALEWWCVGDPDRVLELASGVLAVGKKWASGHGAVLGWSVEDCGDPEFDRVAWSQDGLIARPFPVSMSRSLGLDGIEFEAVSSAIRPPYWRPAIRGEKGVGCWREWNQVIAPWTRRPSCATISA